MTGWGFGLRGVFDFWAGVWIDIDAVICWVVGHGMACRSEAEMWRAFRELDRKIQSFTELRDSLVEQEADACAAADRLDRRVYSLNRKYRRLRKDRIEAEEWVADVALLGVDTQRERERESNAQKMLQTIHTEIVELCVRARALDNKRWLHRYREHYCENGQYELESAIDQLKVDLESILSEGCVSG